jgi:hypothetical protein
LEASAPGSAPASGFSVEALTPMAFANTLVAALAEVTGVVRSRPRHTCSASARSRRRRRPSFVQVSLEGSHLPLTLLRTRSQITPAIQWVKNNTNCGGCCLEDRGLRIRGANEVRPPGTRDQVILGDRASPTRPCRQQRSDEAPPLAAGNHRREKAKNSRLLHLRNSPSDVDGSAGSGSAEQSPPATRRDWTSVLGRLASSLRRQRQ